MKIINDAGIILGMVEDGELIRDLSTAIKDTIVELQDQAGARGSVKGSVTLTLSIVVEGRGVTLEPTLTSKTPTPPRGSTYFFVNKDGSLSTEDPRQPSMFEGGGKRLDREA